jgi:hypothetical protein
MAQTILTCLACQQQAGLQWSNEEPPLDGCPRNDGGRHQWRGGLRIRLVSEVILPEGASTDGLADSVTMFLAGLTDPQAFVTDTRVEHPTESEDCTHPEDEQRSQTETSCGKCGTVLI